MGEYLSAIHRVEIGGQYHTMQYNIMQYHTILYNTIQCNTILCNTIQCNTISCNTIRPGRRRAGDHPSNNLPTHPLSHPFSLSLGNIYLSSLQKRAGKTNEEEEEVETFAQMVCGCSSMNINHYRGNQFSSVFIHHTGCFFSHWYPPKS